MSLKSTYWERDIKCCLTCKFIDEYIMNVANKGEVPHGYDGTASCCKHDENVPVSKENRDWISPLWTACAKYEKCTERQAKYLDAFDEQSQTIVANNEDISKIK